MRMKRGDIYYVERNYAETGDEMKADRPAVIVSQDATNATSDVVEVVFMTTKQKKDTATHVSITSAPQPSTVLCEQIHSVSKQRLSRWCGVLTDRELQAVNKALAVSLGLDITAMEAHPSEEELEALKAQMQQGPVQLIPCNDSALIKAEAERDVYKQLYTQLLDTITKGAAS